MKHDWSSGARHSVNSAKNWSSSCHATYGSFSNKSIKTLIFSTSAAGHLGKVLMRRSMIRKENSDPYSRFIQKTNCFQAANAQAIVLHIQYLHNVPPVITRTPFSMGFYTQTLQFLQLAW